MKLSDIDQNLNEAPVSLLKRAGTKLKKHIPFAPGLRAEAEGADEMEAAARAVGLAFRKWLGSSDIKDKNAIPHTDLLGFFTQVNMGKTAQEVIANVPEVKKLSQGTEQQQGDDSQQQKEQPGMTQNVPNYGEVKVNAESLEARLARMLNEATVDQTNPQEPVVTFSKKEAEKLILDVVSKIYKENQDGLSDWLDMKGVKTDTPNVKDQTETVSDEDFELIRDRIDRLVKDIVGGVSKSGVDSKKRAQLLKLIDQLGDDAIDDLA